MEQYEEKRINNILYGVNALINRYPRVWVKMPTIVTMFFSPLIYILSTTPIKIPAGLSVEFSEVILKFLYKRCRIAKTKAD